jgi:hypothetical protein
MNIGISAQWSLGHYELMQHKAWFDKECSNVLQKKGG